MKTLVKSAVALAFFLPALAHAGTHYAFVKFEANGTVITGNSDSPNASEGELPTLGFTEVSGLNFGLKRDIGTGARVSGHTAYDRMELDLARATPLLLQSLERGHTVNCTIRFFEQAATGRAALEITGTGHFEAIEPRGEGAHAVFLFDAPIDADLGRRAKEFSPHP